MAASRTHMSAEQHALAQLAAELAGLSALEDLPEWERVRINAQLQSVFEHWVVPRMAATLSPAKQRKALAHGKENVKALFDEKQKQGQDMYTPLLKKLHSYVRATIWPLLHGEEIDEPVISQPVYKLSLEKNTLTGWIPSDRVDDGLRRELGMLLRWSPFPFALCPACARVFLASRHRRYCSGNCMTKGVWLGMKDRRREYMKTYMRELRAKEKAAAPKRTAPKRRREATTAA